MTSYATLLNRGMGNEGLNADVSKEGRHMHMPQILHEYSVYFHFCKKWQFAV